MITYGLTVFSRTPVATTLLALSVEYTLLSNRMKLHYIYNNRPILLRNFFSLSPFGHLQNLTMPKATY